MTQAHGAEGHDVGVVEARRELRLAAEEVAEAKRREWGDYREN